MKILVTGAAGFIGSALVRRLLKRGHHVVAFDALTYAGTTLNFEELEGNEKFQFVKGDIRSPGSFLKALNEHNIDQVAHLAAESHVDNSIASPGAFIETNVVGSYQLLVQSLEYYLSLDEQRRRQFRFLHVSTDEVFGSLGNEGFFTEETSYDPRSPYSASKACSDHLVRAWGHTYGLPIVITNCSNNYGPRQFPEKLIPRMIECCLADQALPIYGDGSNVRDWIFVDDHCEGICLALESGKLGESYCFGGRSERTNLQVVSALCDIMDNLRPKGSGSYHDLKSFVQDRLGHDFRYAIDDTKAETELGFKRSYNEFEQGLETTVKWYLENRRWVEGVSNKGS